MIELVDPIESIDGVLVDYQHAGCLREQISAACESTVDAHPLPDHRRRYLGCGRVFRYVARLDARHHDLGNAGGPEGDDLVLSNQRALLKDQTILANRMHRDATLGLADRHRAESHDAFSAVFSAAACRRQAVISPMIATAISGGDTAPMASPIGA